MSSGQYGAGMGGGSGGSIRDAGGAFAKRGASNEEQYFRQKQAEQIEALKKQQQTSSGTSKPSNQINSNDKSTT